MRRLRRLLTGALIVALGGVLFSADFVSRRKVYPVPAQSDTVAQPAQKPRPDIILLPRAADAVPLARADLAQFPPQFHCYFRYLWIPDGAKSSARIASLALNYVSRGSVIISFDLLENGKPGIVPPALIANGHLLRVDLRNYAPRDTDQREWMRIWEGFGFDPMFNLLITKDSVNFAEKLAALTPAPVPGKPVKPVLGRRALDVFRVNAPHLPNSIVDLQAQTHTCAPIVELGYFLTRALSTIRVKIGGIADGTTVYENVWGGEYYRLRGIKKAKDVLGKDTKATDLDLFFENLGIGNIKAGLTQEKLFDKLNSDQRTIAFVSNVTGQPREITSFHTPAQRVGGSWGAITGDGRNQDVDIGDRAFANVLKPRRVAREGIFPGANGLNIFILVNGEGALQDEVPHEVADDRTIPAPHNQRLEIHGCLRCHYIDGSDGWKPLPRDHRRMIAGNLDIFGDLSAGRKAVDFGTVDRLAGLVSDEFDVNLRQARDDVARNTLRACGSFNKAETQAGIARVAGQKMADLHADYNYVLVDARRMLRTLGADVVPSKAVEIFKQLMDLPTPDANGVYLEKPTIVGLATGGSLLRVDVSLVQAEMQSRFDVNIKKVRP